MPTTYRRYPIAEYRAMDRAGIRRHTFARRLFLSHGQVYVLGILVVRFFVSSQATTTQKRSTMVFSIAARAASRRVGLIAKQSTQRRHMAGGGHAAPEWEGIDKIVRGYFPGDHQRALIFAFFVERFLIPFY